MTTPRVTVPVEPLWMMHVIGPDDIYPAPDHATAVQWSAYLNREIAPKVPSVLCVAVPAIWTGSAEEHAGGLPEAIKGWSVPSAAPAPEGGVVEGPGDYTMVLTVPQAFERFPALASHIERMAVGRSVGSLIEWDGFLRELNAALATREDAQPVGWVSPAALQAAQKGETCFVWPRKTDAFPVAIYTHSAPDALRVAVEALEPFAAMARVIEARDRMALGKVRSDDEMIASASWEGGLAVLTMGHLRDALTLAPNAKGWGGMYRRSPALAALQAEQKGGA